MGFFRDWGDHWRLIGSECKAAGIQLWEQPGPTIKMAFTHPLHFAFWWFLVGLYINGSDEWEEDTALMRIWRRRGDHSNLCHLRYVYVSFSVSSVVTGRTGGSSNPPLRDQGFTFPYVNHYSLPNTLLYATVAATGFRFLPIWPCCKPAVMRMIFRRWLFLEGVIFFYRAVSVVVTSCQKQQMKLQRDRRRMLSHAILMILQLSFCLFSAPQPDPSCVTTATGSVWLEAIYISFGVHYTCADCMFSGHTAAITLLMLIWSRYSHGEEFAVCFGFRQGFITSNVDAAGDPTGWKLIDFFLSAWALMCFYFIIATRFHYSTDVFIGFCVTWLLFHCYHLYIKVLAMRQGSFFSRFMRWFEGIEMAMASVKHEVDLEAGRVIQTKPPTDTIFEAGAKMTKDNATVGSPQFVAALPTSYLEGNNYYRPSTDADEKKSMTKDEQDTTLSQDQLKTETTRNWSGELYENNTQLPRQRGRVILDGPLVQTTPTPPIPVIVTGEQAAQDQREVDRAQS